MLRVPGARRRDLNFRQHFVVGQHVLARRVLLRQREEVARPARCARRPGPTMRNVASSATERRRRVRRMDDVARAAAEDRVELVFAGEREAGVAAVLEARETVAEVPAPRPLADVAGERPDVADLRRRDALGRFGEHRVLRADERRCGSARRA